jgi:hypothetical protein
VQQGLVVLGAIVFGVGGAAVAQPVHPKQAKQVKVSFVTAHEPCTSPTLVHRPPLLNGVGSCAPVLSTEATPAGPLTEEVTFGPKGQAQAIIKVAPGDVKIAFKSKDIRNKGVPHSGDLHAAVMVRVSDHACGAMSPFLTPCTVQDIELPITIGCTAGTCSGNFTLNTLIPTLIVVGDEGNVELGQIVIRDGDGDDAFRQGLFLP